MLNIVKIFLQFPDQYTLTILQMLYDFDLCIYRKLIIFIIYFEIEM